MGGRIVYDETLTARRGISLARLRRRRACGGTSLARGREDFLNYFALGLLIFVIVTLFYGIIAIHDVPYEIAKKRDHPHQDAIHAGDG